MAQLLGIFSVAAEAADAGKKVIQSEQAALNCTTEASAVLPALQNQLQQLQAELSNKANITDMLSKAEIHEHFRSFDAALKNHKQAAQGKVSSSRPVNGSVSTQDTVQRRVQALESTFRQLQEGLQLKADRSSTMTKKEVHERFKLYHESQKAAAPDGGTKSEIRQLQASLDQKANRTSTMTKEEIHERFKLFHKSHVASASSNLDARVKLELHKLQAALEEKANRSSTMTKEEIHERFRLFHEAQKATASDLNGNELVPRIERLEVALQETAANLDLMRSVETELRDLQAALSELRSRSGGVGWVSFLLGMSIPTAMAFAGMCLATAAHKQNEDRIRDFEATIALRTHGVNGITHKHHEEGPNFTSKAISGAVGAGIGGATGATVGTAVGGVLGVVAGLVPAIVTFGLSIPIGAVLGSGLGLASGTVIGGGGGALCGVKAIAWYKRQMVHRQRCPTEDESVAEAPQTMSPSEMFGCSADQLADQ